MTLSDSSIMTSDDGIDINTNVMTNNSMDIMTGNSQPLTRTIGKPKRDKDPNELKIASFRTKEGVWAQFSAKAESDGLTATDVLKAAMEQYLSGEYNPRIITGISTTVRHTNNALTRNDVLEIVNTAISISVSTEIIESNIMTAISTLSLPDKDAVSTMINNAISTAEFHTHEDVRRIDVLTHVSTEQSREIAALQAEIDALKKLDAIG